MDDITNGSPAGDQGVTPTQTPAAEPTPIELRDDSLVKIPGSDKPVKYGEHYRGLQGQLTRASQRAAELERKYAQAEAVAREREQQLQRYNTPREQHVNPAADLVGKLKSLAYLTGEDAASMVETIVNQVGQFGTEFQRRDAAIMLLYNQIKRMSDQVNGLQSNHLNSSFESKISRWVGDLGLPVEATDFAKELYLAYEGEGLDDEFPTILKNRWEQITGLSRKAEQARIAQARQLPFVPGKGGQGVPSKPLTDRLAKASPKEVADELWDAMAVEAG